MNHTLSTHSDLSVFHAINAELTRQQDGIELIASENFVSQAVLKAQGSIMTNKYAEGYPGNRYYGGCEFMDCVENLAIDRLKKLFECEYANVQPHSGSQANEAVFLALLNPGDTILGMSLDAGGHLTHGSKVNLSGKWFNAIGYGVLPDSQLIDYDQVRALARAHKPKLIIAGGSAYPRFIDFKLFREIADEVGAYFQVDMAHFAGLVAGGQFDNPLKWAHVVTSTTHKTLRGPRGGIILTNHAELAKKLDFAIFPGLQGGPLMHVIAAKAIAFGEALDSSFKDYAKQIVLNAKAMGDVLKQGGINLITGGTDCHLLLLDLRNHQVAGKDLQEALERAHITCNKNSVPNDPAPPKITSGVRIGTPAITTRGFKEAECKQVAQYIVDIIYSLKNKPGDDSALESKIKQDVLALCSKFPLYSDLQKVS